MATNRRENTEKLDLNLRYAFEHGVNLNARTITISGDIEEETFSLIDAALTEMERHSGKSVTLRINSEGGSVYDALAIVGRLQESKCRIVTEGYGCVMSAATLILASGGKRRISKYATFMHHESIYELGGRHTEVLAEVKQLEKQEDLWAEHLAELSRKTKKFYKDQAKHTNKYWSPAQVLEFGIVDELI